MLLFQAQSGDTSIMIDHSLQHHTRLGGANRNMDEMLDSGSNILSSLRDQRMSLKVKFTLTSVKNIYLNVKIFMMCLTNALSCRLFENLSHGCYVVTYRLNTVF